MQNNKTKSRLEVAEEEEKKKEHIESTQINKQSFVRQIIVEVWNVCCENIYGKSIEYRVTIPYILTLRKPRVEKLQWHTTQQGKEMTRQRWTMNPASAWKACSSATSSPFSMTRKNWGDREKGSLGKKDGRQEYWYLSGLNETNHWWRYIVLQ